MQSRTFFIFFAFALLVCGNAYAQGSPQPTAKNDIAALPGKGLQQHDFLMTGEAERRHNVQTLYVIHKGRLVWTYDIPNKDANGGDTELGDATMRDNGNIVFCRRTGATEVTPDKLVIWNYDAPKGTEIHAVKAVGKDKIFMVINGVPARAMLINIKTGKIESQCILPTGKPGPHLQFRRVVITPKGTYLAAHLDSDAVAEYDTNGKLLWNYTIRKPWCAARLKNGNTLIASNYDKPYISEVNKKGEVVWDLSQADIPGIKLYQVQVAVRLENGNTIFSNWCINGIRNPNDWPNSVQLIEVTPDKKVVWALSQWNNPDIGPASSIQLLDNMDLDKIKAFRVEK